MWKMERKRSASQRAAGSSGRTEEAGKEREEEPLCLVLKFPRGSKRVRGGAILKECLQLETEEQVLEGLLQINESVYPRILDDWKQGVAYIRKLWKKHQSSVAVCSVIIHLLSKLLPLITCSSHVSSSIEFLLSLVHHGTCRVYTCLLTSPPSIPLFLLLLSSLLLSLLLLLLLQSLLKLQPSVCTAGQVSTQCSLRRCANFVYTLTTPTLYCSCVSS